MQELRRHLRKGETVLWQSQPKAFPLLEGRMRTRILVEWFLAVAAAVWFFYMERSNPNFGLGVKVLVALVAAAVILSPVVERYSLKKQQYFLTDQRAVLVGGDRAFYYIDFDQIDRWEVVEDVAQGECIAMGGVILEEVRKQLRWQSCHPKIDLQEARSDGEVLGMVFYLPRDVDRALELLKSAGKAA